MTRKNKLHRQHHWIVLHAWRLLRSVVVLTAAGIWLYSDAPLVVLLLLVLAAIIDQFKGFICHKLEKLLHWKESFHDYQ